MSQANEMNYNVTNSWSINDHNFCPLYFHSTSKYHLRKLMILQISHTGVLSINYKKIYAYFMKKITLSFHAFPVLICSRSLYSLPQSVKWVVGNNDTTYPLQINLTTNLRNSVNLQLAVDQNKF